MVISIVMGRIVNQDLGQSIDLLHHSVDLAVLRAANRNVRQRPREEMAGRPQGLLESVGDLPCHEAPGTSRMSVSHGIRSSKFRICSGR